MIKLFGDLYYIDFEEIDSFLLLDDTNESKTELKTTTERFSNTGILESRTVRVTEQVKHKEINGVKFELIRNFIADIGDEEEETDIINMGNMSISFKLAFNTLLAYDILKKLD
jgi:hypothetical protein